MLQDQVALHLLVDNRVILHSHSVLQQHFRALPFEINGSLFNFEFFLLPFFFSLYLTVFRVLFFLQFELFFGRTNRGSLGVLNRCGRVGFDGPWFGVDPDNFIRSHSYIEDLLLRHDKD